MPTKKKPGTSKSSNKKKRVAKKTPKGRIKSTVRGTSKHGVVTAKKTKVAAKKTATKKEVNMKAVKRKTLSPKKPVPKAINRATAKSKSATARTRRKPAVTTAVKKTKKGAAKKTATKKTRTGKSGMKPNISAQKRKPKKGAPKKERDTQMFSEHVKRPKHTPAVFKLPSKKHTPIVFSLEDVRKVLRSRSKELKKRESRAKKKGKSDETGTPSKQTSKQIVREAIPTEHRRLGAASITDILGFNPDAKRNTRAGEVDRVPRKFLKYYRKLIALRGHVQSGLDLHTKDTLKRSAKEDSGDLSSYGQHMADLGTDNFDRDFALSLVSSEQEALFEIEEALDRIFEGTYGICEITGKPINRERLDAVPFTRFSVEGQKKFESSSQKKVSRQGVFIDSSVAATVKFTDADTED